VLDALQPEQLFIASIVGAIRVALPFFSGYKAIYQRTDEMLMAAAQEVNDGCQYTKSTERCVAQASGRICSCVLQLPSA
jgi:hypothetical protein